MTYQRLKEIWETEACGSFSLTHTVNGGKAFSLHGKEPRMDNMGEVTHSSIAAIIAEADRNGPGFGDVRTILRATREQHHHTKPRIHP